MSYDENDSVIEVQALSKHYRIGSAVDHHKTLRKAVSDGFTGALRGLGILRDSDESEAITTTHAGLDSISFSIREGEVVGLVGDNGAGKSTLLKILSNITSPSEGYALVRGRVGALLEVGTGFHPELTGRENIYLNGAFLGIPQDEIRNSFDQIVDFSEIPEFLDTPVKHYSSGMTLRLAFSVAVHLRTEVMLIDEVLAVGDVPFQRKCVRRLENSVNEGRTVLFTSHDLEAVQQLCPRTIWLRRGRIAADGPSEEVIGDYLGSQNRTTSVAVPSEGKPDESVIDLEPDASGPGHGTRLTVTDIHGFQASYFKLGQSFRVRFQFRMLEKTEEVFAVLSFLSLPRTHVTTLRSHARTLEPGEYEVEFEMSLTVRPGTLRMHVGLVRLGVEFYHESELGTIVIGRETNPDDPISVIGSDVLASRPAFDIREIA